MKAPVGYEAGSSMPQIDSIYKNEKELLADLKDFANRYGAKV